MSVDSLEAIAIVVEVEVYVDDTRHPDWDGVQLQSLTSSLTTEANDKNNNDDGGGGDDTMNFPSSSNISNEEYPNDESNTILDLEDISLLDSENENADSPYQQANDDATIALEQTLPPEVRCLVCCTKFVTRSRRRSITLIISIYVHILDWF